MKMVFCLVAWMVGAVAFSQDVNLSDGMWKLLQEKVAAEVKKDYPEMSNPDSALARLAAQMARDALDPKSPDHGAGLAYDAPRYFADQAARRLGMAVVHQRGVAEPALSIPPEPWKAAQATVLAEVQKDYPDMNRLDSAQWKLATYLARASSVPKRPDYRAGQANDAPRYFADQAAGLLGMPVVHQGSIAGPKVTPRKPSSPDGTSVRAGRAEGERIGEAKITGPSLSWLVTREYSLSAADSPGQADDAARTAVDPRFQFRAGCNEYGDEGVTWSLEITFTQAGRSASPAVTFEKYLALVDQCLDRFLEDVPDAKVDGVVLDHTDDSAILAEILKKLHPRFEAMEKNPPPSPNEIMRGKALKTPPGSMTDFLQAANASTTTQRIGEEMARRLGRKYIRVVNAMDHIGLEHHRDVFYGKPWAELLKDPHLGIDLLDLELDFIFEPRPRVK